MTEQKIICYIASSKSVHTKKWCNYFSEKGYDVHVISFDCEDIPCATVHHLRQAALPGANDAKKLMYLTCGHQVSRILNELQPDIVHAHYATSYGAMAALACKRPYFLSVWGSDVYDFPQKSPLHRLFLKWCLKRATWIMSTSNAMAQETRRYTAKEIDITPFGVDTELFSPAREKSVRSEFVVGTVKGLAAKYGIATILRGSRAALELEPDMPLRIRIAGTGPEGDHLRQLCHDLGLAERTDWLGFVEPEYVPDVWRSFDVALIPSELESESFGVSAVEAQACAIPVVISDIPGLMEATDPGKSSIVIPRGDYHALGRTIVELYRKKDLRQTLGQRGREWVTEMYDLGYCFDRVDAMYRQRSSFDR